MAWQEGNQKRRLSKTRDINKELLEGASKNNQNRLHLGFHYPRCSKTRFFQRMDLGCLKKNIQLFLIKLIKTTIAYIKLKVC